MGARRSMASSGQLPADVTIQHLTADFSGICLVPSKFWYSKKLIMVSLIISATVYSNPSVFGSLIDNYPSH